MKIVPTSDIQKAISTCDLVVVGSGFFGCTIANVVAKQFKKRVVILEKRNHIGGNAHSYLDSDSNIHIHSYGSHLFHTSNENVWTFINRFSSFNNYEHRVISRYQNRYFNLPINLLTLSQFFGVAHTPESAKDLLQITAHNSGQSFEERAIASIGVELYEAFFRDYTFKQWGISPSKLPGSTFSRLPIRFDFDSRYFLDKYQGVPIEGYDALFHNMLADDGINIALNCDFFEFRSFISELGKPLVYTGPLDRFFDYRFGALGWRTLDFEIQKIEMDDFQGTAVMNYPELKYKYTRIHEFKHMHPERAHVGNKTVIMKEFSRPAYPNDEPYYPINSSGDRNALRLYRELQGGVSDVLFGGRLGTYQYLDMHMAIASALSNIEKVLGMIALKR